MREKTYAMLAQNMDRYISGETISRALGITRAAVLKHIHLFQSDGAVINSVNNRGHKLLSYADRLKSEYILPFIKDCPVNIIWYENIGSTNKEAKTLAIAGLPEIACVTAEEQIAGRGRMGRAWVSPKHKGIYASLLLRPLVSAEGAPGITVLIALAVCRTLRSEGLAAKIKWPNDVLIKGKKICGILTEISTNLDGVEYIICGFGLNANLEKKDIPNELKDIATSVYLEKGDFICRTKLLAEVLNAFWEYYQSFLKSGLKELINVYNEFSALHGKTITLISAGHEETGHFIGFDEQAALLMDVNGQIKKYIAGEISLRGFE